MILEFRPQGSLFGVVSAVLLLLVFSFSLSWIWTLLALIIESENALMVTSMMIIFPLTFLSSAFVDPETMPIVLEVFVSINPISMLVDSVRGLMHGYTVGIEIVWTLISSGILLAIFGPLTMYLYKSKN
ncbi:MAG: ABC transporter permease [Alkalibacterium thalassium]|nr:ABC transporter permease [Alkalibacterium thalassium]